jgi:hypothetical protein
MSTTIEGRIVKKSKDEDTGVVHIQLERVDHQEANLVLNSIQLAESFNIHQWVRAEYDSATGTVSSMESIEEPTLDELARERRWLGMKFRPITRVLAAIAFILGAIATFLQWDAPIISLYFWIPCAVFFILSLYTAQREL